MGLRLRGATLFAITIFVATTLSARVGYSGVISAWNGSTGDWNDAIRWSTNPFFPNNGNGAPSYDATIGAGMVNLNTDIGLTTISLNGGVLNGTGNLATDILTLDGGTLGTTGSLTVGTADLIVGTLDHDLTLSGVANTIQNLKVGNGFTLTNSVGATLTATTGPGERETFGPGSLINEGTFIKTGNTRFYASLAMNNDGIVQVEEGTLRMNSVGTHEGVFTISNGASLELNGEQTFQPTATISGLGGLTIQGGTATINSEVSTGSIRITGGTLTGSGNLNPDAFFLDDGTLDRDLTLSGNANTIQNLKVGNGFTLTNPVGATLTATTGPGERETVGPGSLINEGTFIKTGNTRFYASLPMNNDGIVQVEEGTLRMNSVGTHTGVFTVSDGAQLELNGEQTFQPTATISGLGGLTIQGGTATINSEVSTGSIRITGGTLTGSGNLNPDAFFLDDGTLDRDLALSGNANTIQNLKVGNGFTLTNPVGATLTATTGPGERETVGPGSLINEGTFIKTGNTRFYASLPMINDGVVQVEEGTLRMNSVGTHAGTFAVSNGASLELNGDQTFQPTATISGLGGLRVLGGTATINSEVSTSFLRIDNGELTGNGSLQPTQFVFVGGTLVRDITLQNTAIHTLQSLEISNGFALTNPVGTEINATSGTVYGAGSFINQGTIAKTGVDTENFVTFTNTPSGEVDVQAGVLRLAGIGTQEGTFTVSGGAALTFGGLPDSETTLTTGTLITGDGTVNVVQGILNVPSGASSDYAGGTTVGSGGRVNITGAGTGLSPATATIESGGVVSIEAASNLLASQALVQTGGTLAVRNEFIPQSQIAPVSSGTFGIDVLGFSTTVDMSVLGNGEMSLGSSTTGSYTSPTLVPGAGDTYRVGGGGGTITFTQPNVLTGDRPVQIVGPGTIVLPEAQNFTQGTTIQAGTVALGSSGSLGVGPIAFQGGGMRGEGGPVSLNNDLTWDGNITLSGNQDLTINGPTQLTGNRTLTVTNTATTTITQGITENAFGRRLTKGGPGTLVLAGDTLISGGLSVLGGTLVLESDQHYIGSTIVNVDSSLVVQGDILGSSTVSVLGGSTIQGEGLIAGMTTIGNDSTISPGFSPGAFSFSQGLALQNGSHFEWELAALSTDNPSLDWDQIVLTGGDLSILAGAVLDLAFIESATAPGLGSPFWSSTRRWKNILDLKGTATNPTGYVDFDIDNSQWDQFGTFDTMSAESGLGVDLVWNPVPEPSTIALAFLGSALLILIRLRKVGFHPSAWHCTTGIVAALCCLVFVASAPAATIFTEDVTISDPDEYFSVEIKEDAAVTVIGGYVENRLHLLDTATGELSGGWVNSLYLEHQNVATILPGAYVNTYIGVRGTSQLEIHGGRMPDRWLEAIDNSVVKLFVQEFTYQSGGGQWGDGQVLGTWSDDVPFAMDLYGSETFSHLHFTIVPEPSGMVLSAFGAFAFWGFAAVGIPRRTS